MSSPRDPEGRTGGRWPRDLLVGVVLLAFCGLAYWVTLSFEEAPAALAQNVQPATFPRLVIAVIAVLGALMIVLGLPLKEPLRRRPPVPVFVTAAMMVAFVAALERLGIMVAMIVFALAMPILWGERRPVPLLLYCVIFPTAIWVVFVELLDVRFEPGVIQNLFG
ncbi:tripartite tricarboxylate transporter TctB family protein [Acuticoccus sp.]|uniref:tripartite tricarboxylate transporter TctB family protein n=1 Tax=Acuticoccus sp. TaxID=1904378 RepID=UPI003B520F44